MQYTVEHAETQIALKLNNVFGCRPEDAGNDLFYKACVLCIKDILKGQRIDYLEKTKNNKNINYFCMEFLMGRSLKNNLFNLELEPVFAEALKKYKCNLTALYEQEPDAALGNGGLGRLAACFLDGLTTGEYSAYGYSILYEFGVFKQKLIEGWQTELPDFWLSQSNVWFTDKPDQAVEVRFGGTIKEYWDGDYHNMDYQNYTTVKAMPHDMMISGYGTKAVNVLRLWSSASAGLDMQLFNQGDYLRAMEQDSMAEVISKVLYPSDNHHEGKSLRLKQQYFLVSASVQDIVKRHLNEHRNILTLPNYEAIHINDTHPALAIPELMRIIMDDLGYGWDDAWKIVNKTFAYTNHTVMSEALECWNESDFATLLPRIYSIVCEIDRRQRISVWESSNLSALVEQTAVISNGSISMANLSVIASHHVNGVAKIHSEIIKETIFNNFYKTSPDKFTNVTNGIAHRRWLNQCNPDLAAFITSLIGDKYIKNASELKKLLPYSNDKAVLQKLFEIKLNNKKTLAQFVEQKYNRKINPNSIFDTQIKRLHEYKRQHLNILRIITDYLSIKNGLCTDFTPRTYIFGGKAAPGYFMAKEIIKLIYNISVLVENDPDVNKLMSVIYLEDYRVTLAELIIPATEISEQISLAGTEASGTSNMKFMLNGALTLGTLDGANVEICKEAGAENCFIFGMTTNQVNNLNKSGYNFRDYIAQNVMLNEAVKFINSGINGINFSHIYESDPYKVMADYQSYIHTQKAAESLYKNKDDWNKKSLINIANSGLFSSDRSIADYANNIWDAKPV